MMHQLRVYSQRVNASAVRVVDSALERVEAFKRDADGGSGEPAGGERLRAVPYKRKSGWS